MSPEVQKVLEILSLLAGVGYAVLAARRNRLCWIAGALGSAILALVSGLGHLPMQAGLNIFYVVVSAYGWWNWTRTSTAGELPVSRWPLQLHIAASIGISVRYLYRLFARESTTLGREILRIRLEKAAGTMQDRQFDKLSIAEISWRSGFSDPSYFSKCFRSRYGMAPGAFRQAGWNQRQVCN